MTNKEQDQLNKHVVMKKSIDIIESVYESVSSTINKSYVSDRVVYLNTYIQEPTRQIPKHVFKSAYNMLIPKVRVLNRYGYEGMNTSDLYVLMDVTSELKRIADEPDTDE